MFFICFSNKKGRNFSYRSVDTNLVLRLQVDEDVTKYDPPSSKFRRQEIPH